MDVTVTQWMNNQRSVLSLTIFAILHIVNNFVVFN